MSFNKIKIDKTLIFYMFLLFLTSLLSIYSASIYLSKTLGNLVLKQSMWYLLGILIIIVIYRFKITSFINIAPYIYILNILLLIGLLFFAPEINGSKCWYVINGVGSFQPSEFMKISLLIMQVYLIEKFKKKCPSPTIFQEFKLLVLVFIIFIIPSLITFLEPDTGAVIIYFIITITILFISKIRLQWFVIMFIVVSLFLAIFFGIYFYKQNLFIKILGSDFF